MTDYNFTNPDGSAVTFSVSTPEVSGYQFTPGPPAAPPDPFLLGTSFKSQTDAANWFNSHFGLIFFNPANGTPFSSAKVAAAMSAYPKILWCICDKGDASTSVPQVVALAKGANRQLWYAYDQEPEGEDPTKYRTGTTTARQVIDRADARDLVKVVGKFARYPEIQNPGAYKSFWCGTKDNPVEDIFGTDSYARPGIQFPANRYGTADELFGWGFDAAASLGVPHAVTECARLVISTDPAGSALANVVADDVAYLRANHALVYSYWPGKGGATNPDGSPVDFTPPALVRSALATMIRSQG